MKPATRVISQLIESSNGRLAEMAGEEALNKISDFYDYSVWKCVPCSWLIHVQVCVDGETTIERWCCVQGSSDVSERGLRMHSTLDEYETTMNQMLMLPKACALIFVDGKKQNPHFVRTDGSGFTNPSTDDLIFLLTAMIPVAEFICHYSELGSVDGISASDIFSQASVASNNFPGEQVVKTMSFWEDKAVVVKMNASPNHNPFKHSMLGGATSRVSRDKELKTKCTVCEKTDEGMLQCVRCKSASYCSKECQRLDWPRHKKHCTNNRAFTKSSKPCDQSTDQDGEVTEFGLHSLQGDPVTSWYLDGLEAGEDPEILLEKLKRELPDSSL